MIPAVLEHIDDDKKEIKEAINKLEDSMKILSDSDLKNNTSKLKKIFEKEKDTPKTVLMYDDFKQKTYARLSSHKHFNEVLAP